MASILGIEDNELVDSIESSMEAALIDWGNETIDRLRRSLQESTSDITSGGLEQSLVVLPVEYEGNLWTLSFQAEDYWKFINEGVRGIGGVHQSDSEYFQEGDAYPIKAPQSPFSFTTKKPPVNVSSTSGSSLRQWSHRAGLNEYAVRESIFRSGIKATHFYDKVVNQKWIKVLTKKLEKAGAREIKISLERGFKAQVKGI